MMLYGLSNGSGIGSIFDTAIDYISGKAKSGAEEAIPEIQAQVEATVKPYVITSFIIGAFGLLFGVAAYMRVRRFTTKGS